ncbi:MAG: outer membrane lipoprotein-sorting protein [Spirochaetes bacterium]|uniref:Outer membrane lipoprotein-sorting protein n=1 Tax=Candidatus Avitreponema avistercoris TaxID=2840705 RepID=A0A9D9HG15_9SPIR|nr:outer membrane lipoprotein-sorting protein [Candidatus Avitreponema avistercoris]
MRLFVKNAAALGFLLAAGVSVFALDGRTVMQQADDVKKPDYSHTLVKMDLIEKNGQVETRVVEQWGMRKNGLNSVVMIFRSPASVKNTRFLQIENEGRADDKWIYLPALRNTRRIAASEGDKSFMGTDATYDDMSSREVDDDRHELLEEKSINGFACYVVRSEPVDPDSSQYQYRVSYIDKATMVPVFVQMYDKQGGLVKELTVERLQNVNGYDTPVETLLENVQTGHATRMVITNIEVDKPVPDKVFTQNFLNTGRF